MVERTGNRRFFLLDLLVPLVDLVPFAHHIAAALQILRRDDFRFEIRMVLLEAVAVVALCLQLLAVQLGQLLDGVDIVERVTVGGKRKLSGIKLLEKRLFVLCHAAQHRLFSARLRVVQDFLQRRLYVARARRIKIRRNAVFRQPLRHEACRLRNLSVVALPEVHIVEGHVHTRKVCRIRDVMNPAVVGNGRFVKIQHKNLLFCFFVSII